MVLDPYFADTSHTFKRQQDTSILSLCCPRGSGAVV